MFTEYSGQMSVTYNLFPIGVSPDILFFKYYICPIV